MKNISTGFGLCVLGLGIAAWPVLDRLMPQANAVGIGTTAVTAVAAAATAQDPPAPTVVWMGVTEAVSLSPFGVGSYSSVSGGWIYHRLWSNGRQEGRFLGFGIDQPAQNCVVILVPPLANPCFDTGWIEIPAPPGGNGFACRTDLNGDRSVDGVDLGIMLSAWGPSAACNPDPTFACVGFGGGIAP